MSENDSEEFTNSFSIPAVLVAGISSGVGKTSIAVAIMHALHRRGLKVQPFKVGPDFLDPMHHKLASGGVPSINLDGWMMDRYGCLDAFQRSCESSRADVAVIEGCMGLYDGIDGKSEVGSTAEMAKWLQTPVVLVLDVWNVSRSAAAMVHGYVSFDPLVAFAGVIFNKVGGESHEHWLREAITSSPLTKDIMVIGSLPMNQSVAIKERALGLNVPTDDDSTRRRLILLSNMIEKHCDLDAILSAGSRQRQLIPHHISQINSIMITTKAKCSTKLPPVRIAIARDEAFCFYYEDNLHILEMIDNVILLCFSPLRDSHLLSDIQALYLGGGYPEHYGNELESNLSMKASILEFISGNGLVYAECGGLMYLSRRIYYGTKDNALKSFSMVGALDIDVSMTPRMTMGYCTARPSTALCNLLRLPHTTILKCQQYHFSEISIGYQSAEILDEQGSIKGYHGIEKCALTVTMERPNAIPYPEGIVQGSIIASYCHIHFGSSPEFAIAFIQAARQRMRIASLDCAGTEIVCAILSTPDPIIDDSEFDRLSGIRHRIVGVSEFCDYPPLVTAFPKLSTSLITATRSEEIEQQVQLLHTQGIRDLHVIDTNLLVRARPTIILTQEACDRCSATKSYVESALLSSNIDVQSTLLVRPLTIQDVLDSIMLVGESIGERARSKTLVESLELRLKTVHDIISKQASTQPLVLGLESTYPLVASGQWLPDMRQRAGGIDALHGVPGCPPCRISWQSIVTASPEVIIVSCCGKSSHESASEIARHLAHLPGFWDLPALQSVPTRLFTVDHQVFSRPGPRLIDGIEVIAAILFSQIAFPIQPSAPVSVLQYLGERFIPPNIICESFKDPLFATSLDCRALKNISDETVMNEIPDTPSSEYMPRDDTVDQIKEVTSALRHSWSAVNVMSMTDADTPPELSAHVLLSSNRCSILLVGGEMPPADDCKASRTATVWECKQCQEDEDGFDGLKQHRSWVWRRLHCTSVFGENVPTARSNHAAAIWGDILLVFGGWDDSGLKPLARLELLHLSSLSWTHGSSTGCAPSARGNPSLVIDKLRNMAIVFGGWDGQQRFNDVYALDLMSWAWTKVVVSGDSNVSEEANCPCTRSDHSSVFWDMNSTMVVFGGSTESADALQDVWLLHISDDYHSWAWQCLDTVGERPSGRTSHAAVIYQHSMIVSGGAQSPAVLSSCFVLDLHTKCWSKFPNLIVPCCRHSMTVFEDTLFSFGGYTGDSNSDCLASIDLHSLSMHATDSKDMVTCISKTSETVQTNEDHCFEKPFWNTTRPLTLADLDNDISPEVQEIIREIADLDDDEDKDKESYMLLHRVACERGYQQYVDPTTGYTVFTSLFLGKRSCCGNKCRHCPWGHRNVPKKLPELVDDW